MLKPLLIEANASYRNLFGDGKFSDVRHFNYAKHSFMSPRFCKLLFLKLEKLSTFLTGS